MNDDSDNITIEFYGLEQARYLATQMVDRAMPFAYVPLPDDAHQFIYKYEHEDFVLSSVKTRELGFVVMLEDFAEDDFRAKAYDRLYVLHRRGQYVDGEWVTMLLLRDRESYVAWVNQKLVSWLVVEE
jgi:hypothetical protein